MKRKTVLKLCQVLFLPAIATAISISGLSCGKGKFKCDNFRCIPVGWVCDGSPDCKDATDEKPINCPEGVTLQPATCTPSQFQCGNLYCLPMKWKCDGTDDCGDGSDEKAELCQHSCKESEFTCGNGQCIAAHWRCDGRVDCIDGNDERNCTSIRQDVPPGNVFRCNEGFTVPIKWRCDGDSDCADGSDEKDCENFRKDSGVIVSASGSNKTSDTKCRSFEFKCPNSYCILKSWTCDGIGDCPNGEDEQGCKSCQTDDEFRCKDGSKCLKNKLKCNGIADCPNGSDEEGCPKVVSSVTTNTTVITNSSKSASKDNTPSGPTEVVAKGVIPASAEVNKTPQETTTIGVETITKKKETICNTTTHFLCNVGGKCISRDKLCDGKDDCRDKKDESVEECGVNECSRSNGGCMQQCINSKEGHTCACTEGFRLVGKYSCEDINECKEVPGICSQECVNTEGGFRCFCLPGYLRDPADYTRCKAAVGEVYLLFSHSYDIRSLRLRDKDMTSVVQHTRSAIALDYLFEEGQILWSDKKDKKIYRARLADTNIREVLVSDEEVSADGLAVDWIHHNIYYTDTEKSAIRILSWDAKHVKTLVEEKVGHPRAIAVSPNTGHIYWTDWGSTAKIERSALDGSDRRAIVTNPHVVWPNGITIDHPTQRIYWCDGRLRTISAANLDGTNIEVILYSPVFLRLPFSISVFEDRLYWTDWSQIALFSADKFTGENIQNVSAGHLLESPKVVHVYHQYRQPVTENICAEHSCSHFCLRSTIGEAFCACADGYDLSEEDKFTCVIAEVLTKEKIISVQLPKDDVIETPDNTIDTIRQGFVLYKEAERNSEVGFIIGGTFGALLAIAVIVAVYVVWSRTKQRTVQRIRFHNPVYRKTTVEDCDGRGFTIGQDKLFYNPTSTLDYSNDIPVTDADDAPLTPKCLEEDD